MKMNHRPILLLSALACSACSMSSFGNVNKTGVISDSSFHDNVGSIQFDNPVNENENLDHPQNNEFDQTMPSANVYVDPEEGEYVEGTILVESKHFDESMLDSIQYVNVSRIFSSGDWYKVALDPEADTKGSIIQLRSTLLFDNVDYELKFQSDDVKHPEPGGPAHGNNDYLEAVGVLNGWQYMANNGGTAGGTSDVVVAVIDTGVDYNHPDLCNNIWHNAAEIPNNGIDDDQNGYIDDCIGWDFVGNDTDPMDDNGHGTHVAGIIAAENNNIGITGVAYGCNVMCLKAGNLDGYFTESDVIKAIQYAFDNGASVINMSIGGSGASKALENAIDWAYERCLCVAAAGNESKCNYIGCPEHSEQGFIKRVTYPAAYRNVVGVMSCDKHGNRISSFSNYDHYLYSLPEYEVYAPGEGIVSTYPNNRYANMSGTSMSSPVVAGIAALLRSFYTDRDAYSNRYIAAQITETGSKALYGGRKVANLFNAFTTSPKPMLQFDDYKVFDIKTLSAGNNNDGSLDAGELIHLGIDSFNVTGVAKDIRITLTQDENDGHVDEPYVSIVNSQIQVSNIGTYSVGTGGNVYNEDGELIDYQNAFTISVSENCPHNISKHFNVLYQYKNGMNDNDHSQYESYFEHAFSITISNGEVITGNIESDLTLTANKKYIFRGTVTVLRSATLTIEEGVEIERTDNYSTIIYGTLIANGSENAPIKISSAITNIKCYGPTDLRYVIGYGFSDVNLNENYLGNYLAHTIDHCIISGTFYSTIITNSKISGTVIGCSLSDNYIPSITLETVPSTFFRNFIYQMELDYGGYYSSLDVPVITDNYFYKKVEPKSDYISYTGAFYRNNFADDAYVSERLNSFGEKSVQIRSEADGTANNADLWPFITNILILDSNGNETSVVGSGSVTFRVTFNTDIDTGKDFYLLFGPDYPYNEYKINGSFVDSKTWESEYVIKSTILNGEVQLIAGGNELCASCDLWKTVYTDITYRKEIIYQKPFTIDTTQALSMTMFADAQGDGVHLSWIQDDYDTLMGYNVYRSSEKNGVYTRINPVVIPSDTNEYCDDSAEPGQTYWYTFTVVLTDMSESLPAGKVSVTAMDTIAPVIYHTPINLGYEGNNLIISCSASDNVAVATATLHYRMHGSDDWKTTSMTKSNDRYVGIIYGNEVTLAGIDYYIEASDGFNSVFRGSESQPFTIVIKDASWTSILGDVDGDGIITTRDALMILRAINDEILLTQDEFDRADLNHDGELSSFEVLRILQYINGNIDSLEM